jgi:digeranylgeranylglycerophospholipid reductase
LDKFIETQPGLKKGSIIEVNCGCVPVGAFLEDMTADNLLIAGDAAHQVNPIHGGGIGLAMEGADIASDVAIKAFKENDFSHDFLKQYNGLWYEARGNKLKAILKKRHMFENLHDKDFETLAANISGDDVMKLSAGDLVEAAKVVTKKLIKSPGLVKVMLKYLR